MNQSAERLHAAMFTNVYKPVLNGVAVSVESFRQALIERGHQVSVFAPSVSDYKDTERFVVRYPALELPMQKYPLTVPVSNFANQYLEVTRPDVLHAHHPALLGRAAVQKSEEHEWPLVFTYHTRYHDYAHYAEPFPKERVKELITHWLGHFMASCHRVVVPSESIREMVAETYGLGDGVEVVSTGIDFHRFASTDRAAARSRRGWSDDELVLVSVGRLAVEKNFALLLEAVSHIPESLKWRLVIVGEGDLRPQLEQQALQLGIAERVDLVGQVPYEEMPQYLAGADLFCFASVTETQGLVTVEAMASGLPVAAVRASGTSDVVENGRQGLLTAVNAEALAEAITRLLQDDSLRDTFARQARETAAIYTPQRQAARLEEVYREAMEACRLGRRLAPQVQSHWQAFIDFVGLSPAV